MDQIDRQIADLLRENGRRSNVEIARALGISEGTVRKRIDRLLSSGALRIVGMADPRVAGFKTRVLITLTVELSQVEAAGRLLRDLSHVISVYRVTGEHDIIFEAVFESDERLMSFLTDQVARIPGVVSCKTSHLLRVLKHGYEWAVPRPPPPIIMIVDDDPNFLEATRMVLETGGYATCSAASGKEALEAMAAREPDLMILDVMMDGVLDGWDTSRRIRSDLRLRDLPILMVSSITASDYLGMVPTDEDNMIDNFLSKPVDPKQLLSEVRRLLKRRNGKEAGRAW